MLDRGFEIAGICPVARHADGMRAVELDAGSFGLIGLGHR